jgi:molecular chaperone HscA
MTPGNAAQDPANTISSETHDGALSRRYQNRYPHLPYQLQASENGLPMIQTAGGLLNPIRVSADILKALAAGPPKRWPANSTAW